MKKLKPPHDEYSDDDIKHRTVYVEASRGCPYGCEFCLSSREKAVRKVPTEVFLASLENLWHRGARRFKFIDRALHLADAKAILDFFRDRDRFEKDFFLHFEAIPDHLPSWVIDRLGSFPAGSIQLEIGVQTFDQEIARRIGRNQDMDRCARTIARLRNETGVHLHTDLIVGLPGQCLPSFAKSFDMLYLLNPHEIQVGLLKRLRGTTVGRHDQNWDMVYSSDPPYEIVRTRTLSFDNLQRLRRFGRYLDLVVNSGNFPSTTGLITQDRSPFQALFDLSNWLWSDSHKSHSIALHRLARLLYRYLVEVLHTSPEQAQASLDSDYHRAGREPIVLELETSSPDSDTSPTSDLPPRQARHHERPKK
jgi:hypothetical protein